MEYARLDFHEKLQYTPMRLKEIVKKVKSGVNLENFVINLYGVKFSPNASLPDSL